MIWEVFNGIGVDRVGVNLLFCCVSLSCLHSACVFALSRFFVLFRFCFLPFFLFPLFFFVFLCFSLFFFVFLCFSLFFFVFLCFSLFFFVFLCFSLFFFASSFLFIRFKRFECFLHICRQLLSIVPQSSATGKLQKPEKGNFAPAPSIPTLSETFKRCSFFKTQTQ